MHKSMPVYSSVKLGGSTSVPKLTTNFRIILRKGRLFLLHANGSEGPLVPLADDLFQVGEAQTPERICSDTQIDGQMLRASLSGCLYYRALTP
jgi:hypothetical protein